MTQSEVSRMAKIYVTGGTKGGGSKTTVATNLACLAAALGFRALLVDADDQESSWDFSVIREEDHPTAPKIECRKILGNAVRTEVLKLAPQYDYVIIDTGGRDTTSLRAALTVADILLAPFAPRAFDIWTLGKAVALVQEFQTVNPNLKAYSFLSKADPEGQGTDNKDVTKMLKNENDTITFLNTPLAYLKAYSHAAGAGLAVTELKRYRNTTANKQINKLFQRCFNVK